MKSYVLLGINILKLLVDKYSYKNTQRILKLHIRKVMQFKNCTKNLERQLIQENIQITTKGRNKRKVKII
jgi:hypothetical protein